MATKRPPAEEALERAKTARKTAKTWVDLHNKVFGIGGLFVELFPDQASRVAFSKTDEYAQIVTMIEELMSGTEATVADASGQVIVRLPKSVHRALVKEAEAEGVSMNQLIVAKLSVQLRATVGV